ncbi:MAG: spore germination protein GerPE [Bacilli bacterium]
MYPRTSVVGHVNCVTVTLGSVFQVGDSDVIRNRSNALVVQREWPYFFTDEYNQVPFHTFLLPFPLPPKRERLENFHIQNESPVISVGGVSLLSASAASVFQIGSTSWIDEECRILQIRQYITDDEQTVSEKFAEVALEKSQNRYEYEQLLQRGKKVRDSTN